MTESRFEFNDDEPRGGGIGVALLLLIPGLVLAAALVFALMLIGVR